MKALTMSPPSRSRGFTLIELAVVALILSVLIGLAVWGYAAKRSDQTAGIARDQLVQGFPEAAMSYQAVAGSLVGMTAATLQERVSPTTPWNESWTLSNVTANGFRITYPITGSLDMPTHGPAITAFVNSKSNGSATATWASPNVIVDYQIR